MKNMFRLLLLSVGFLLIFRVTYADKNPQTNNKGRRDYKTNGCGLCRRI